MPTKIQIGTCRALEEGRACKFSMGAWTWTPSAGRKLTHARCPGCGEPLNQTTLRGGRLAPKFHDVEGEPEFVELWRARYTYRSRWQRMAEGEGGRWHYTDEWNAWDERTILGAPARSPERAAELAEESSSNPHHQIELVRIIRIERVR